MHTHNRCTSFHLYKIYLIFFFLLILPQRLVFAGGFDLVSRGNNGSLPSDFFSGDHSAMTSDGRFVVFSSSETGLVSPPTTGKQVFLRDRMLGKTQLISRNNLGAFGNGTSDWPAISDNGCRVVYESNASNLVTGDTNAAIDVFMLDRCINPDQPTTALVSVNSTGIQANGESKSADISADGNIIAFWTLGTNLGVAEQAQIYLRDLQAGTTRLVSSNREDLSKGANSASYYPVVSDDGKRIAFWSYANNLVAADSNAAGDIFLYDVDTGMQLVSTDSAGVQQSQQGDGGNVPTWPAISGDGKFVAFASLSPTLGANDTNGVSDIFVKNTQTGELIQASVNSAGAAGNAESIGRPALSLDGRWVAFLSKATNLTSEAGGDFPHIFAHNTLTHETIGFTTAPTNDYPAISGDLDGRYVSAYWHGYVSPLISTGVFVYDKNAAGNATNQLPIAAAVTRPTIIVGDTATLDASISSDPEGVPLKYNWSWISGPETAVLSDSKSATPTFISTKTGTHIFQLVVQDDVQNSKPGFVAVDVVLDDSTSPIQIDAGQSKSANIGDPVSLKSTVQILNPLIKSSKLKYQWKLLSGPVKNNIPVNVKLNGKGKSKNTGFIPTVPGRYIFGVEASQGSYKSLQDFVVIEVNPVITVSEPTASTVWEVGSFVDIKWAVNGINPNKKLAVIFSVDQEKGPFLLLKNGIKAGKGQATIKVNAGLISDKAFVAVCLLKTAKNDMVCGSAATFKVK
jgi:hypothetical protein